MTLKKIITLSIVLLCNITFSQEVKNVHLLTDKKTTPEKEQTTTKNTEIQIKSNVEKTKNTTPDQDTITYSNTESIDQNRIYVNLQDEQYLRDLEEKWAKKTQYSNSIFEKNYTPSGDRIKTVSDDMLRYRLEVLDSQTPMDLAYNPVVKAYVDRYAKSGKWFSKTLGLAEYYFPLFEQILDKYNIPIEMKYLAVVESALKPRAASRAGAKGLWQFIFSTAKMYGLEVNSYVDERFDPYLSTEAACKMMREMYNMFGDWNLVLAAYNSGPGNVLKAIRRSGQYRNYWNIRNNLPRETQGYVPSFIAVNYIFAHAKDHNMYPVLPKTSLYDTDTIHVKKTLSFKHISEKINISIEELELLNPAFKLNIIPKSENKLYALRLPREKLQEFLQQEDYIYYNMEEKLATKEQVLPKMVVAKSIKKKSRKKTIYHRVRKGQTLGHIARKYKTTVSKLKKWNRLRSSRISINQKLKIYR